jgi:hypothetical protein
MRLLPLLMAALGLAPALRAADEVVLTRLPDRVRIDVGGRPFSEYVFTGRHYPYLYPVLAADGTPLTRDFPIKDTPGEDHDHPHQISLWFAHGLMNGIDFWNQGTAGGPAPKGQVVHDALLETTSGAVGVVHATSRWLAPDGSLICTDDTTLRIQGADGVRILDYEVTLHALADKPLLMGDSKEGTLGIRLAQWMTLPHKYGGKDLPGSGHILTGAGDSDGAAWGKRAAWCDYYAPHAGKVYGVAIFDDPRNLRHPTWWMARDYGLFGANPFGQHSYENTADPHSGDYPIPAGGSLTLRYRFYFHEGDPVAAQLAGHYAEYVKNIPPAP